MLRKLLIYTLIMVIALPAVLVSANGADLTVMDRTATVEKILYGDVQTGSLVDRVGRIERELYGVETRDALIGKLDRVYRYMKDNSAEPSFLIKLNGVEWTLSRTITAQPVKTRIEELERMMVGQLPEGALDERLTQLVKLSYPDGQVEVAGTTLNKDSLIKIKLETPLNTKTSRAGDIVKFQVSEDVYVGTLLVISQGSPGVGKVVKVEEAQNFGRDAKLEIAFDSVEAIDGSVIATELGEKAKQETRSMAKAAGASVAGMVLLGPIGIVGGAFVHGKNIILPTGTELFIQSKADEAVYGIRAR